MVFGTSLPLRSSLSFSRKPVGGGMAGLLPRLGGAGPFIFPFPFHPSYRGKCFPCAERFCFSMWSDFVF